MNDENKSPRRGMARARPKRTGRSKNLKISRPIMIGVALILAAAAFLFWPRGGSSPTGIGDRMSVVTADTGNDAMVPGGEPRSGEVAIENETSDLVPEKVKTTQAGTDKPASSEPQATSDEVKTTTKQEPAKADTRSTTTPTTKTASTTEATKSSPPATTPRSAQKKPEPTTISKIEPTASGGWAIQVGAFSKEENAQRNINDLKSKGYPALMHAASTSGGEILYKVWIGYFKNREEAAIYGRDHRRQLGESIPVHR
jgi:cell division septation protein DedD